MLDGDFSQYVEPTNLDEDLTVNPDLLSAWHIVLLLTSSSSALAADHSEVPPPVLQKVQLSQFLFGLTPRNKKSQKQGTVGGAETTISTALFDPHTSPRDTGERRLERLLSQAADEAMDKIQQRRNNLVSVSPTIEMTSPKAEQTTKRPPAIPQNSKRN